MNRMLLTIEMPDESIVKHEVVDTTTLHEIATLVNLVHPVFFCDRWKGQLGTLISMTPNDEPIYRFNTNSIALVDRNHIKERDVPRYYEAMTKGY
jgi:hypothetical protein